jgi:hypothetical protein
MSCGGRVDHADAPDDAGSLLDVGNGSEDATKAGDAGAATCSSPMVWLADAAPSCAFVIQCTDGTAYSTINGQCVGGNSLILQCLVNGSPRNAYTMLGMCDCANPAGFATLATQCLP